ncbi:MAG TPA: hypothetical protein VGR50_05455 [Terriglobales bacterium]|nr:hypothetical protein [Terriglobales bacterium]
MKKATAFVLPLVLLVLLAFIGSASGAGEPKSLLPQPNGCYPVGTKTVVLRDAHRNRDLLVTLWYPAAGPTEALAPYMDKKTAQAIAQDWELQPGFERDIRTNSSLGPAPAKGSFSVVLLEHGSGMVPAVYSILAEGLASNGFFVVATNHPPDSLISVLPDGRESRFAPYWPEKASRHDQGVAIGKFAEDVLLADVRFVLDQLQEMNTRDDLWRGHFDLAKIASSATPWAAPLRVWPSRKSRASSPESISTDRPIPA